MTGASDYSHLKDNYLGKLRVSSITDVIYYSQVPNKRVGGKIGYWKMKKVGPNKQVGWKIC